MSSDPVGSKNNPAGGFSSPSGEQGQHGNGIGVSAPTWQPTGELKTGWTAHMSAGENYFRDEAGKRHPWVPGSEKTEDGWIIPGHSGQGIQGGGLSTYIQRDPPYSGPANTTGTGGNYGSLISSPSPEDLQVNSSTEARPIPVVFGTGLVAGNYIRYDNNRFRNQPITVTQTVAGTTFQGIVGYRYYLTFDIGLCIGPIDSINSVLVKPGDTELLAAPITFGGGNRQIQVWDDSEGFAGITYVYGGSLTQVRTGAVDLYDDGVGLKGVSFVHFKDFGLGDIPSPKTLSFEVARLPKPYNAAGSLLASFPTRGSDNAGHPSYNDANPAAAMWEILTNKNWGANIPHALLDEDSFRAAAQYLAANDMGLSFTLASGDYVDGVINHLLRNVSAVLVWTGDILRLTCLTDVDSAHATRIRLTEDQINGMVIERGGWASAFNELRLTFTNHANGYEPENVIVQDLASINALGRIQSTNIETSFANREIAEIQAKRILRDLAYPRGRLSFETTRYGSGIEPGSLIELIDRSHGDPSTTYWRVKQIQDAQTTTGILKVDCAEDLLAVGFRGIEPTFQTPTELYLQGEIRTPAEIALGDDNRLEDTGPFGPGLIYEIPSTLTGGNQVAILGIQRQDTVTARAAMSWVTTEFPAVAPWAYIGTLDGTVSVTRRTDRLLEIDVLMEFAADIEAMEAACNFINLTTDDLSTLTQETNNLLFIGGEIMRVGWAEDQGGGVVRLTGLIRGEFGSTIASHAINDEVMFIEAWQDTHSLNVGGFPWGQVVTLDFIPITNRGTVLTGNAIDIDKTFTGLGTKPFPPSLHGTPTEVGLDWEFRFRPRLISRGAGLPYASLESQITDLLIDLPSNLGYRIEARNSGDALLGQVTLGERFEASPAYMPAIVGITAYRFIPDTGQSQTCLVEIEATPDVTVDRFRIYTIIDGKESANYLLIDPTP